MLVVQSCPTVCDPVDWSPPGSSVHEIFQARILEWVAISFSRGPSQPRDRTRSPALQAGPLPTELQEKPNTQNFHMSWMNSDLLTFHASACYWLCPVLKCRPTGLFPHLRPPEPHRAPSLVWTLQKDWRYVGHRYHCWLLNFPSEGFCVPNV